MAYDIRKLRQQYTLGGRPPIDIMSGTGPTYPEGGILPHPPDTGVRSEELSDPTDRMKRRWDQINQIYTPESAARERFDTLLGQIPQRQEPSTARKIVASGMGWDARQRAGVPGREFTATANPIPTMEAAMYAPYNRQLADWKERVDPYGKAAELENRANINERTLAGNMLTAETQMEREDLRYRTAEEKNRIQEEYNKARVENTRLRNLAYAAAVQQRAIQWDFSGPTVKYTEGREVIDTGVETGKMTELEKIELQNIGRIQAARETGANAANVANIRESLLVQDSRGKQFKYDASSGRFDAADGTEDQPQGTITVVGTPRSSAATRPETRAQRLEGRQERLRELVGDPDHRKWIIPDPKAPGDFIMTPRPTRNRAWGAKGAAALAEDQAHWDRVNALANGTEYVPPSTPPPTTSTIPPTTSTVPPATSTVPPTTTSTVPPAAGTQNPNKTVVKREYSPSRNQTRITYSDGSIQLIQGR